MATKRASEQKSARTSAHVAQVVRRPSMEKPSDMAAEIRRAVAEVLQERGVVSPVAASAPSSTPVVIVTSRDMPEGVAVDFMSNNSVSASSGFFVLVVYVCLCSSLLCHTICAQYYLDDGGVAALRATFLRAVPRLKDLPHFDQRVLVCVRNARSHIAMQVRTAMADLLPHTRSSDGTVVVRCACVPVWVGACGCVRVGGCVGACGCVCALVLVVVRIVVLP